MKTNITALECLQKSQYVMTFMENNLTLLYMFLKLRIKSYI